MRCELYYIVFEILVMSRKESNERLETDVEIHIIQWKMHRQDRLGIEQC